MKELRSYDLQHSWQVVGPLDSYFGKGKKKSSVKKYKNEKYECFYSTKKLKKKKSVITFLYYFN